MNRINQLFSSNPKDLLSIYFCAGTPTLEGTAEVIRALEKHGVHKPYATGCRSNFCLNSCIISAGM